ncbi:MAG: GNAT family N-acetyltransferase, partial [Candidatus Limnocylindrales bacterium]
MIERRIFEAQDIPEIVPAWQALAERAARSPFESPAWLMAWLRHYGSSWQPFVLTWWRADQLVGVAPLASRLRRIRGIPVRELEFWGRTDTPLSGWVDVVAEDGVRDELLADFAVWLARPSVDWDLFHFLHLAPDSLSLAALTSIPRHWRIDLTRVLHSLEYTLSLPADASSWQGQLGPKARHEIRRQMRAFERRMDGRIEVLTDPGSADSLVTALRSHGAERWGEREAYFRRDPLFADFFADALRGHHEAGLQPVRVACDDRPARPHLEMASERVGEEVGEDRVAPEIGFPFAPSHGPMRPQRRHQRIGAAGVGQDLDPPIHAALERAHLAPDLVARLGAQLALPARGVGRKRQRVLQRVE